MWLGKIFIQRINFGFKRYLLNVNFRGVSFHAENSTLNSANYRQGFVQRLKWTHSIIIVLFPLFSMAQESVLSGKVTAAEDLPVVAANVILMDKDSVTVDWGVTDDEGKYRIENIDPGSYMLKIKSMGYKTKTTEIVIDSSPSEHNILLEQDMLDEVVVTQPRIERKADRVIFSVQNSTLSNGNTWNVLANTPYLTAMGGSLSFKGREEPLIYINDRRSYLSAGELKQLLEGTPAELISNVEVIHAPPARYSAEGRVIVNIVMRKNLSIGYNGNVRSSYKQGVYPKYQFGTGHFYKTGKLNLYAGYSGDIKKTYQFHENNITFFTGGAPSGEWNSVAEEVRDIRIHNANINLDYDINDNHVLNFSGNASIRTALDRLTQSNTEAYDIVTKQPDSSFNSVIRSTYPKHNIGLNLDYKYDIGKGKKLRTNFHYTNYGYENNQNISTDYIINSDGSERDNAFTNEMEQNINIYTGRLDYSASAKDSDFEAGIGWGNISFDNQIDQSSLSGTSEEFSNIFFYDETNLSAYISYEKNWEQWDLELGFRGENTSLRGVSVSNNEINEQDYFKIFPSLYVTYKPADNHRFDLSYTKKIERPRYNMLNPFRQYINDNAYVTGNPNLLPAINHRINLTHTYNRSLSFNVYLFHFNNNTAQLSYVNNDDNKLIYADANLDKAMEYGLDISWDTDVTSWWYLSIYFNVLYAENYFYAVESNNELVKTGRWGTFNTLSNSFTLSKDKTFTGNLWFQYLNNRIKGNIVEKEMANLTIGLQKTFWNKRAIVSLYLNDILDTRPYYSNVRYLDQDINSFYDAEFQSFEINFTYKFGNYRLRTNKKSIRKKERDRL